MSQRGKHPLEDDFDPSVMAESERAAADAKNRAIVEAFHRWVFATHERYEIELPYLRARRQLLHMAAKKNPDSEEGKNFAHVCLALGRAEAVFSLLDEYVADIRDNSTGEIDLAHQSGTVLWIYYRDFVLNPKPAPPTASPPLG